MLATEPRRKTLPLLAIAEHWEATSALPDAYFRSIGVGEPSCFRCGWLPPVVDTTGYGPAEPPEGFEEWSIGRRLSYVWRQAGRYLDVAHLVDWSATQDDSLDNVVPLCHYPCHDRMPAFGAGRRDEALAYVLEHPRKSPYWQVFTDAQGDYGVLTSRRDLKRLYVTFLERMASVQAHQSGGRETDG